jgi:pimeloyl-ACP methyl ester carboxylesterase
MAVSLGLAGRWSDSHSSDVTATRQPSPSETIFTGVTALDAYYHQVLKWKDCKDGFDCSRLSVPLDYRHPEGQSISLAVIRLKAHNPVGSLVLNPGGPGGSGIDYARAANYVVTTNLIQRYDIVGFDPRGVGQSTPVHCLSDAETDTMIAADGSPDSQSEIDRLLELNKHLATSCQRKSADLYRFVDTVSAARDIDILRSALGDEKLNWLGKSYGTFLGATYAELFPKRVGRMVLDGVIDPGLSNTELSHGQAIGFEDALRRFISDCPSHDDCPLADSPNVAYKQVSGMLDKLDSHPATLKNGRIFTQAMAVVGVLGSLYDKQYGWEQLRSDLAKAFKSSFDGLATSLDFYISRGSDGTYLDNSNDAIAAINCLDRPDRPSVDKTLALVKQWRKVAPLFGEYLAWSNVSCTFWRTPATSKPHQISAQGSAKILLVGTTHDPATPYVWAQSLAKQLADSTLVTLDGDGHTAYMQGSPCIDKFVDRYFATGQTKSGVVCRDAP